MRVSMSEIGSVILIAASLPAGLTEAGDITAHRRLAQLGAREAKLAIRAVRAPRQRAAIAQPNRVRVARQLLQLLLRLGLRVVRGFRVANELLELGALRGVTLDRLLAVALTHQHGFLGHGLTISPQRELECLEQRAAGVVVASRRRDRDVEAADGIDLVEIDFRKNDLLFDAEVVIAAAVERATRHAAEVADTRHCN